MQLVHRTRYWGQHIDGTDNDEEVPFHAIWVQTTRQGRCCCPGFGERRVHVEDSDIAEEAQGWWSLFLVSTERGHSPGHYFWKYVLIPQDTYGFGKKGCARRGWRYIGEVHSNSATAQLENLVGDKLEDDYDNDFNHVHIGIKFDGLLFAGKGNSF